MSKVLQELSKIEQPGKAERTSEPPVIVAVVGLYHRDEVLEILETDSVPDDVQNLLTLPTGRGREALTTGELWEYLQLELERERITAILLNNCNLEVSDLWVEKRAD